jgi:hypothetical protein
MGICDQLKLLSNTSLLHCLLRREAESCCFCSCRLDCQEQYARSSAIERERQWGREKAWREAQEAGTLMWPVNVEVGGVSANQVARACHVGGREGGVGPARVGSGREG